MLVWKGGERERLKRRVAKPQARRPSAASQGKATLKAVKPEPKEQGPRAKQQTKQPNKSLDLLAITIPDLDPLQPNNSLAEGEEAEGLGELHLPVDWELN
jgi:hypothetical protein